MNASSLGQGVHFAHAIFLWVTIAVCLLFVVGFWLRKNTDSASGLQSNKQSLFGRSYPVFFSLLRYRVHRLLLLIALAFLGLAIANPRGGYTMLPVAQKGDSVVLLLDVSQSMLVEDMQPSRLERAKREIKDLVKALAGSRFALVVFAGGAALNAPFTRDVEALFEYVDSASPAMLDWPGTSLVRALEKAESILTADSKDSQASRRGVFVFSDGENEKSKKASEAIALARKMHRENIQVYAFGFGTDRGGNIPDPDGGFFRSPRGGLESSSLQFALLEKVASAGGGIALRSQPLRSDTRRVVTDFSLGTGGALQAKDSLQENGREERRRVWNELYQWPLGVALCLMLLESWLGFYARLRGRTADRATPMHDRVKILEGS